jgi:hypothetical protein
MALVIGASQHAAVGWMVGLRSLCSVALLHNTSGRRGLNV